MKIGQKIWLSLITILCLLLVIACYSVWSAITVESSITTIQATNTRAITSARAENEYTGAVLEIRRYIAEGDEKYSKNFEEKLNSVIALENQLLALTPANQRSQVEKLISDTEQYRNGVVSRLIPLLREQFGQKLAGNAEKAALAGQQSAAVTRELTPFAQSIQKTLNASVDENSKMASNEVTRVNSDVAAGVKFSVILGLCATVLGLVMSYFLTKQLTTPIRIVTDEINTMASGDFTAEQNKELSIRRDEFGQVAQSLSQMRMNLKQLLLTIQEKSELLSAASEQLQASAEQSALASTRANLSTS
ncbi:MAG: methyl-accepting chemotaxis sensory transducer with TarH (aspartate) sensor [Anaerospora sp.]|nr:methyl-accepting chemotaxis sensory transducer with TarH (aspartate) sensor [Anaerospora sp.]